MEDKGYVIQLNLAEVRQFTLVGDAAAEAQDTPWKPGRKVRTERSAWFIVCCI